MELLLKLSPMISLENTSNMNDMRKYLHWLTIYLNLLTMYKVFLFSFCPLINQRTLISVLLFKLPDVILSIFEIKANHFQTTYSVVLNDTLTTLLTKLPHLK